MMNGHHNRGNSKPDGNSPGCGRYPLTRKLALLGDLSRERCHLVDELHGQAHSYSAGSRVTISSNGMNTPKVLVSGWMARFRSLRDGRRKVLSFILPGDFVGPFEDDEATIEVECLSDVIVSDVSALVSQVRSLELPPEIKQALWLDFRFERALMLNAIDRLSRQSGYERIAHFYVDMLFRLKLVGLVTNNSYACPVTQPVLADALSLSVVQVSRLSTQLTRQGLLLRDRRSVKILNLDRLRAEAEYAHPVGPMAWPDKLRPHDCRDPKPPMSF